MPRTHHPPAHDRYSVSGEPFVFLDAAICRAREIADVRAELKSPGFRAGVAVRRGSGEDGPVALVVKPTALVLEGLP